MHTFALSYAKEEKSFAYQKNTEEKSLLRKRESSEISFPQDSNRSLSLFPLELRGGFSHRSIKPSSIEISVVFILLLEKSQLLQISGEFPSLLV